MPETPLPRIGGMTLQLQVGDIAEARSFYGRIFGQPPAFEPHDDFLEWPVIRGQEAWIQIVGVSKNPVANPNRVRFQVEHAAAARRALLEAGIDATEVSSLPGVVSFVDFDDPWGNALGYYEDLAPSGAQPTYAGTSVHDESLFVTEPE